MKTFTSHIRDTQTLLTEMKTATRPILSHENDPENTAVKSQSSHLPEACSKQNKRRNDVRFENDDRHYSHSISTASLSGELPSDYSSRNIDFSNKHAPSYTSNDHEFPESEHERNPTTDRA